MLEQQTTSGHTDSTPVRQRHLGHSSWLRIERISNERTHVYLQLEAWGDFTPSSRILLIAATINSWVSS